MDPLLLAAAVVVGFTAFTAYATALGKKILEREIVKLEKTREEKAGQLQIVTKRRKSADGSRKLFRRLREEKRAAKDGLVEELAELEKKAEDAEIEAAIEEEDAEGAEEVVAKGEGATADGDATEASGERSDADEEEVAPVVESERGEKKIKVKIKGKAAGDGEGEDQESGEHDKKIKVRFPTEQRGLNQ
ncbi:MAG: hypothetical protein HOC74_02510 [Gemmatimonadetes bacterium]|jgi:hypothetical protein|nr:hypothetical protein [Gemmatimonadota bacterium]